MSALKEKCGVLGAIGKKIDVGRLSFYGLFALPHRGQEADGICVSNGKEINSEKGLGLVSQIFTEDAITRLEGTVAIAHNRYSTSHSDAPLEDQIQPYVCKHNSLALAHNGNLPNTKLLENFLKEKGWINKTPQLPRQW